jgi:hypothetical protein
MIMITYSVKTIIYSKNVPQAIYPLDNITFKCAFQLLSAFKTVHSWMSTCY